MHFLFIVMAVVVQALAKLCSRQTIQVDLSSYKIPKTNSYRYAMEMNRARLGMSRNESGVAFVGNVSTLVLKNQQGVQFVYEAVGFGFQCPALHKPAHTKEEIIELQIAHRFRPFQSSPHPSMPAPYEWLLLSFSFIVSEYVPDNSLSISRLLDSIQNGSQFDLGEVLQQQVTGETLVYTTRDWRFGEKSVLRMIRKQIRLMSKDQFIKLKMLIEDGAQLQRNQGQAKAETKSPQKIYQIKSFPFAQSIAFRKEDL